MAIDFECPDCGKCCHDLKAPSIVKEAIEWLADENDVRAYKMAA